MCTDACDLGDRGRVVAVDHVFGTDDMMSLVVIGDASAYTHELPGGRESGSEPGGRDALEDAQDLVPVSCPVDTSGHVISATLRTIVVDNLLAFAGSLGLSNSVLFLAVGCFDRCIAASPTTLELLYQLGVACLWVAAKHDAAAAPPASVFANLPLSAPQSSGVKHTAFTIEHLVALESQILSMLGSSPVSVDHTGSQLDRIVRRLQGKHKAAGPAGGQMQQQLYSMMSYLAEVSLLEYQLLPFPPAQLAAAAFALAHVLLGIPLDTAALVEATGYTVSQLQTPLQYLCALHTTLVQAFANGKPYTVSVKYSAPALHRVACVAPLCDPSDARVAL